MTQSVWLNFPVRDIGKSREFFKKIGFELNENRSNEQMASFFVGSERTVVLFFAEEVFKSFTKNEISDTLKGTEVLVSLGAESREAVDETARKVFDAGGTIFGEPAEIQGWMYGFGFTDLDGHRWNMVYMDFSKMPQA